MKLKNFNKNTRVKTTYVKYRFKYLIESPNGQLTFKYHKNDYFLITAIKEIPYNLYFKNLKVSTYTVCYLLTNEPFNLYLK